MAIRITAKSGPNEGEVFEFGNEKTDILFGRAHEADIQWPHSDATKHLSARHFSLRFELGHYRIIMQSDNYVYLDGELVKDEIELPIGSHLIAVGAKDGPSYEVTSSYADLEVPVTEPIYAKKKTAREEASGKFFKVAASIVVLALISVGGYQYLFEKSETIEDQMAANAADFIASIEEQKAKVEGLEKRSFSEVLPALEKSVYLVAARRGEQLLGSGTAWVVGDGTLATNAHVVEGMKGYAEKGYEVVVVANYPPYQQHVIKQVIAHPHYGEFAKYLKEKPVFDDRGNRLNFVTGYDVGLLYTDDVDGLAPALKLASATDLIDLNSADEVAYIGYPMENMVAGGVNARKPEPQQQVGNITSITDYFLTSTDPLQNQFVQFSMGAGGGASGSPIFNHNGEVVALLSGGNLTVVNNTRIDVGGVNFGQRVDVLKELVNGSVNDISDARKAYWDNRSTEYKSFVDALHMSMAYDVREKTGKDVQSVFRGKKKLASDPQLNRILFRFELDIQTAGQVDVMIASAVGGEDIDMFLVNEKLNILARSDGSDSTPRLIINGLQEGKDKALLTNAYIFVMGPKAGIEFELVWSRAE